jgi:hypothetical protein
MELRIKRKTVYIITALMLVAFFAGWMLAVVVPYSNFP